jgi:hypothetical protein
LQDLELMQPYYLEVVLIGSGAANIRGKPRIVNATDITPAPAITNADNFGVIGCNANVDNTAFRIPLVPASVREVFQVTLYKANASTNSVFLTDGTNDIYEFTIRNFAVMFQVANGLILPVAVIQDV